MFKRYDLYIIRTLLISMLGVLLSLALLMTMFGFVDEARGTDETRSFLTILGTVLTDIPSSLAEIVSYVVLVGVLVGLGSMSQNSEVTVLRAAGVSPWRICGSVTFAAVVFYGGIVVLSESVTGILSSQLFQNDPTNQTSSSAWFRESNSFIQIQAFDESGNIHGFERYEFDAGERLSKIIRAETAQLDRENARFLLIDVSEKTFTPAGIESLTSPTRVWKPQSDPTSLKRRLLQDPTKYSLWDLFDQITYLRNEDESSRLLEISVWTRLTKPISIAALVLVAVGFVIGPLRETGMGTRIAVGLGVGIVLEYLNRMLVPLALLYELPPFVVVWLPILIVFLCGFILLRRVN